FAHEDHGREVALRIVFYVLVHQFVGRSLSRRREQDRVAVWRRARDIGRANVAGGAALVFNDERLAEFFAQIMRETPCHYIRSGAWRNRNHEGHWTRRPRFGTTWRGLREPE